MYLLRCFGPLGDFTEFGRKKVRLLGFETSFPCNQYKMETVG